MCFTSSVFSLCLSPIVCSHSVSHWPLLCFTNSPWKDVQCAWGQGQSIWAVVCLRKVNRLRMSTRVFHFAPMCFNIVSLSTEFHCHMNSAPMSFINGVPLSKEVWLVCKKKKRRAVCLRLRAVLCNIPTPYTLPALQCIVFHFHSTPYTFPALSWMPSITAL